MEFYLTKEPESLKNEMETLEQNNEMVEDFRRRAPDQIRIRFNWDHIADQYIDVFEQLQHQ